MNEDKQYIAIIADVIGSKQIKERNVFQEILTESIEQMNQLFTTDIVSNLTITLGDEFQGVLKNAEATFMIIDLLNLRLRLESKKKLNTEVYLRWGIGIGALNVPIKDQKQSLGSDGPAYWNARQAIEEIHQKNNQGMTNERILTGTKVDNEWNSIIKLQNIIRNQWTLTQAETAYISLKIFQYKAIDNRFLQQKLIKRLGKSVSEQAVSKRIISSNIRQYSESRKLLAFKINEWRK